MQDVKKKSEGRSRKLAAGALLGLGILGLGMAAASQLTMDWNGNFQAGAVQVEADCQESTIQVGFGDPSFAAGSSVPWDIDAVNFTEVDAKCAGSSYEVAYKATGGEWEKLAQGTVAGSSITAGLGDVDPQTIDEMALTIYSE